MINSAEGAVTFLVEKGKTAQLADWYDGVIDAAGLDKTDPRLMFGKPMFDGPQAGRCCAAPPRHPRTRRPLHQGPERLGHPQNPHPTPVRGPRPGPAIARLS